MLGHYANTWTREVSSPIGLVQTCESFFFSDVDFLPSWHPLTSVVVVQLSYDVRTVRGGFSVNWDVCICAGEAPAASTATAKSWPPTGVERLVAAWVGSGCSSFTIARLLLFCCCRMDRRRRTELYITTYRMTTTTRQVGYMNVYSFW